MSGKVTELRPLRRMDIALLNTLIQELVERYLRPRGFKKEFEARVIESVRNSMKPLDKWYGELSVVLAAELTPDQHAAVERAFGELIARLQADVLGVVLTETYLRVSAVQQAEDAGLLVVPIKDL